VRLLPEFPATQRIVIAFRLVGTPLDIGTHDLDVRVVDEDGRTLATAPPTQIGVVARRSTLRRVVLPGVLLMAPEFPRAGEYAVDFFVDGRQVGSCPLVVRDAQPLATATGR
jgi:hypothetical protein